MRASAQLDVYGLKIAVGGEWPEVVEAVRLDFAWFEQDDVKNAAVDIEIERRPPDFAVFGELVAAFVTPRNVVYQDNGRTVVDYFGRAVSVYDRKSRRLVIQGEDEHLVHEAAYHFSSPPWVSTSRSRGFRACTRSDLSARKEVWR